MQMQIKALLWAAGILIAAIVMKMNGIEGSASFGVIGGLTGAAWASLSADAPCARGCLQ